MDGYLIDYGERMENMRQLAIFEASRHTSARYFVKQVPISEFFGECVFTLDKMKDYMGDNAYKALSDAIKHKKQIASDLADEIADAMKKWAMEQGATHYTHLFQPMTGTTAEKHEAFLSVKNGKPFEEFKGSTLVQQEPDASSFPNGGLRNTFEARGYSAWDPNSPVFILDETLCIPSIFVSYTGDALDMKVPNIRALNALDKAAAAVVQIFDPEVKSVGVSCGLEQEYFLVDESLYNARPDLQVCGRTLVGHMAAKDQQLSDHYFGAIPSRVECFMKDFETEAYRLGIQLKTRHNEVAPNQFECAPVFCDLTTAIDQNMLLMIVMRKVAEKHHLKVLFHEKPFNGVNGSGKHVNWSLVSDKGKNLLNPGELPQNNKCFLALYSSIVRAIYCHHLLLMTSVSSLNNSYRLGGHEAPPAIMSIFSGRVISGVIDAILKGNNANEETKTDSLLVSDNMPLIHTDNTDRNRTSPFAFIGNRFEFRALGASMNATAATYILDSIVAAGLVDFKNRVDAYVKNGKSKDEAVDSVIKEFFKEGQPILFEGNGYSEEWLAEAKRRGLKGVTNVPEAFDIYIDEDTTTMFKSIGVLSQVEMDARYEVVNESFVKKLQIESRTMGELCSNTIIPSAISFLNMLSTSLMASVELSKVANSTCGTTKRLYEETVSLIDSISGNVKKMTDERATANDIKDISQRAKVYSNTVLKTMQIIRSDVDYLESIMDNSLWPLPKYRELFVI